MKDVERDGTTRTWDCSFNPFGEMGVTGSVLSRSSGQPGRDHTPTSRNPHGAAITISSVSVEEEDANLECHDLSSTASTQAPTQPLRSGRSSTVTVRAGALLSNQATSTGSLNVPVWTSRQGGSEVEKLRRELDMLRSGRDRQVAELQSLNSNLQAENNRLRSELKMERSISSKLRDERNRATEAKEDAFQRVKSFEQERDRLQKKFKTYRETKEKEIASLLRGRQELERKLQKLFHHRPTTFSDRSNSGSVQEWFSSAGDGDIQSLLPNQGAPELARALIDANGPFTNVSKGWSVDRN